MKENVGALAPQASVFLYDPGDTEVTQLTGLAHRAARAQVDSQVIAHPNVGAYPVQLMNLADGSLIAWEVHGQSSATGHGKQGLRPQRVELLRMLEAQGIPVLLTFVEGRNSWRQAWLHDLPAARPISLGQDGDPNSKRYGWPAHEFEKGNGSLDLPETVAAPRERAQEAML